MKEADQQGFHNYSGPCEGTSVQAGLGWAGVAGGGGLGGEVGMGRSLPLLPRPAAIISFLAAYKNIYAVTSPSAH